MIKYNQPLKKNIVEKLQLAKFDWSIVGYYYNLVTGKVLVQVLMEKDGAQNQREFSVTPIGNINEQTILVQLLKLSPFKGSKLI